MAVLTSVDLDEQIDNVRAEMRKLKQEISDRQSDLKVVKVKLEGLVAVGKMMREDDRSA